jgi:hypothetical protein
MREKMLKLPPEFYTGQPVERFKRLAKALMAVPKKELDREIAKDSKRPTGRASKRPNRSRS